MSQPDTTRATLLVRLKDARDRIAWDQFAQVYMPMVHRYCRRRGLQHADATDVTQEVMKTVSQAIARFEYDPQRGKFRDWLFTVTRSKISNLICRRHERGTGRTTIQQQLDEQPGREEAAEWNEDCRRELFEWAARRARAEFQATTWQAFYRTAVKGQEVKVVADATRLSANAVYVARSRVIARLRELVAELGDEAELF